RALGGGRLLHGRDLRGDGLAGLLRPGPGRDGVPLGTRAGTARGGGLRAFGGAGGRDDAEGEIGRVGGGHLVERRAHTGERRGELRLVQLRGGVRGGDGLGGGAVEEIAVAGRHEAGAQRAGTH